MATGSLVVDTENQVVPEMFAAAVAGNQVVLGMWAVVVIENQAVV